MNSSGVSKSKIIVVVYHREGVNSHTDEINMNITQCRLCNEPVICNERNEPVI